MGKRITSLLLTLLLVLSLAGAGVQTAQAADRVAGNGHPYYITVNRTANTVTVYGLDADGYYTVPVKAMICSVGRQGSITPRGNYSLGNKRAWLRMVDGSYGQYATAFYGSYLFHSVCYSAANPAKLLTYEYNMLGGPASLGCVRLQTIDAKWIYDNCAAGTKVKIYDAADPGPLGKPDKLVHEITPELDNGWDPTDPRENNPWHSRFITGVSLSASKAELIAGESLSLAAQFTPSDAVVPQVTWSSSDSGVASVDAGGRVVGLRPGTAAITVSCGSVSASCTVTVEKELLPFADVTPGAWYYSDIRYVYEAGVMNAMREGSFSPEMPVTYMQVQQELLRLPGGEKAGAAAIETDPLRRLTRQELAVMLYQHETLRRGRPAGGLDVLSGFSDAGKVDADAWEAVSWAVGSRLLQGTEQNTLDPTAFVSRAQEAAILHRYLLNSQ